MKFRLFIFFFWILSGLIYCEVKLFGACRRGEFKMLIGAESHIPFQKKKKFIIYPGLPRWLRRSRVVYFRLSSSIFAEDHIGDLGRESWAMDLRAGSIKPTRYVQNPSPSSHSPRWELGPFLSLSLCRCSLEAPNLGEVNNRIRLQPMKSIG